MILYLGNEENATFIKDVLDEEIVYQTIHNEVAIQNLFKNAKEQAYNWIFIDMDNVYIDRNIVVQHVIEIAQINRLAKIVIVAKGYSNRSSIVISLENAGFYNVITAELEGDAAAQLRDILLGKNIPITEQSIHINSVDEADEGSKIRIGIVGACSRIGTTTQALQIVLYLQLCGKKAAYIEANSSGFIKSLDNIYDDLEKDNKLGLTRCNDIDFYEDLSILSKILELDYDYYIYDMGHIDDDKFSFPSFFEKDMQIIVGGFASTELPNMMRLVSNKLLSAKTQWLFSFVDDNLKEDVKQSMEIYANQTYFSPIACDPMFFNINNKELYAEMLNITVKDKQKKKPFGIFRR